MNPKYLGWTVITMSIMVVSLLLWFGNQLSRQQALACEQACGTLGGASCTLESCPYHENSSNSLIIGIISVLVAFVGGLGSYIAFSKKERIIEQKEYDISSLNEDEKQVFMIVKESKESIYQSDIVEKLDLSKVKVTRILDKLEQNGLIERKRRGMTNIVVLK